MPRITPVHQQELNRNYKKKVQFLPYVRVRLGPSRSDFMPMDISRYWYSRLELSKMKLEQRLARIILIRIKSNLKGRSFAISSVHNEILCTEGNRPPIPETSTQCSSNWNREYITNLYQECCEIARMDAIDEYCPGKRGN